MISFNPHIHLKCKTTGCISERTKLKFRKEAIYQGLSRTGVSTQLFDSWICSLNHRTNCLQICSQRMRGQSSRILSQPSNSSFVVLHTEIQCRVYWNKGPQPYFKNCLKHLHSLYCLRVASSLHMEPRRAHAVHSRVTKWWKEKPHWLATKSKIFDFPGGSVGKNPSASSGDTGFIPGLGRSPGEGNGNPLQYSCLGNSMDREAWQATVHGIAKELDMT